MSIDIFLCKETYKQPQFFAKILGYFEDYFSEDSHEKKGIKCYILMRILKAAEILEIVTFK